MMICLFALGFAAFAIVNALAVVGVADHVSQTTRRDGPAARNDERLAVTKLAA